MYDLIVIGGGPAGSAAAITAARKGARVLLLERGRYPRHKVCGEFVSPEALGILRALLGHGSDQTALDSAPRIQRARLFIDGHTFEAQVAPPAASIARFELDAALWSAAEACGVECRQQATAESITAAGAHFRITTSAGAVEAKAVVDASGRWSNLNRGATPNRRWLGLKAHFASEHAQDSTDLYFFPGGYCGVQPVGRGRLNVCAMVRADVATTLEQVMAGHPRLASASRGWQPVTDTVATSPLLFRPPVAVRDGVLCVGDAAGFVDPFVGDGIALALRTARVAAEVLCDTGFDFVRAARKYTQEYRRQFMPILRAAARLRRMLSVPAAIRAPFLPLLYIPAISSCLVRRTRAAK